MKKVFFYLYLCAYIVLNIYAQVSSASLNVAHHLKCSLSSPEKKHDIIIIINISINKAHK